MDHCQLDVSFFSSMFIRNILLYSDQRKSSHLVRFTEKSLIILWEYLLIHVYYLKKFLYPNFISLVMLLDSTNLAVFISQSFRLSVCPSMAMLCMIVWFSDFFQKLQFHDHIKVKEQALIQTKSGLDFSPSHEISTIDFAMNLWKLSEHGVAPFLVKSAFFVNIRCCPNILD